MVLRDDKWGHPVSKTSGVGTGTKVAIRFYFILFALGPNSPIITIITPLIIKERLMDAWDILSNRN